MNRPLWVVGTPPHEPMAFQLWMSLPPSHVARARVVQVALADRRNVAPAAGDEHTEKQAAKVLPTEPRPHG